MYVHVQSDVEGDKVGLVLTCTVALLVDVVPSTSLRYWVSRNSSSVNVLRGSKKGAESPCPCSLWGEKTVEGLTLHHVMNNWNTHAHMHVYTCTCHTTDYNMCTLSVWKNTTIYSTIYIYTNVKTILNVESCMRVTRLVEANSSMQAKISCSNNNDMHSPCKY